MKYSNYSVIETRKKDAFERFKTIVGHAGLYRTAGHKWAIVFGDYLDKADNNQMLKLVEKK